MRAPGPVIALVLAMALVVTALPVDAKPGAPLPKTEKAAKAMARDVLQDTDDTSAKLLAKARKLLRTVRDDAAGAVPPVPGLPPLPTTAQGALEVRASLVQPGVLGVDMLVGAIWVGASEHYWTGVYWAESDGAGQLTPRAVDLGTEGTILFVEGGALATGAAVNITYHFLGLDGRHVVHALGAIPIYGATPLLDRVDVGGAHASSSGGDHEALLITPWNLFGRNVTMGLTSLAGDEIVDDITLTACADWEAEVVEPGCRMLYALAFPAELTSLELWYLDGSGERVVERQLTRAELLAGVIFKPG